jgi:hypothetical protein
MLLVGDARYQQKEEETFLEQRRSFLNSSMVNVP